MQNTLTAAEIKRRSNAALQWLLAQPGTGARDKKEIDAGLGEARDW